MRERLVRRVGRIISGSFNSLIDMLLSELGLNSGDINGLTQAFCSSPNDKTSPRITTDTAEPGNDELQEDESSLASTPDVTGDIDGGGSAVEAVT